ncbi:MAG TPA: carboxylating nicotinate-nucleotide diphosphorylase [bacterium]|jgi:nicotinate-nucleotide pyrophosphorylase (carboxylating)|nr:carboxylating nicotinate-nucleotide diphosphorylase [bacterium]
MKPSGSPLLSEPLSPGASKALIAAALREDLGSGDLTTRWTVSPRQGAHAVLVARQGGVAAGLPLFARVFRHLDARVKVRLLVREGRAFSAGTTLARLQGPARALLSGERVALNFAQRLCGIATLTRAFVTAARARSRSVAVLDTRKTTPLLRALEKYAVACGGGLNHRRGLYDAVLIKDNHIKAAGSVSAAVRRAALSKAAVQVEVEDLAQLDEALEAGADSVLLDNFTPARLRGAVARVRRFKQRTGRRVLTEASGGITLKSVGAFAASGVDRISVGALTHSAPALDLSMEFELR